MNEAFVDALREEFRPRAVAAVLAVLVALAVVGDDLWQVAYLGALAALAGVLSAAMEAEMLDRRLVWIGVGCVLGVGGAVLWLSGEGNVAGRVLAAVALLAGPWLALDSAVARWTGIDAAADRPDLGLEDANAGEAMLTMQVTRLVHEELRAADHPCRSASSRNGPTSGNAASRLPSSSWNTTPGRLPLTPGTSPTIPTPANEVRSAGLAAG
ncbi:hypothetical protein [Halospeciosus flavus]|uniref:hypothetical protein n=1 Tax=Halospeciosus flavus TaxID=3032283 RepID=UPI0036232BE9